jgi:glycosyltransferase involved in cell wall biosynthesis
MPKTASSRKVLFIAYYFPPLGMGGTQRIAKFCKYLAREGWHVSVITVKPIAYYAYDDSLLAELSAIRIIRTGSLDPARLLYLLRKKNGPIPPTPANGRNLLHWFLLPDPRILWAPFALWHAWLEICRNKIPYIVTSGPPHSSHLIGWFLSCFLKIRWLGDFRDTWLRAEFSQAPTAVHRCLQNALEKLVVRKAHALTAVSRGLLQELLKQGTRAEGTSHFLPHGFDHEDFAAACRKDETQFTVTYAGAISNIQDPRPLLLGFRQFVQRTALTSAEACLHFVGADLTGELEKWIDENNLASYARLAGYQPHAQAVNAMRAADLLVFIANPGTGRTIVASKTFEYLATGNPILALGEKIEGVQMLLENAVCRHCAFDDVAGIMRALLAFYAEFRTGQRPPPFRPRMEFSRAHLAQQLAKILSGM